MTKQPFFKKTLSSKSTSYLLILLLLVVLVSLGREIFRQVNLRREANYLKEELTYLEQENTNLIEDLEKTQTEFFREKAARTQLGLRKEGEQMIIIVDEGVKEEKEEENYFSQQVSNFKIWWEKFFNKEK